MHCLKHGQYLEIKRPVLSVARWPPTWNLKVLHVSLQVLSMIYYTVAEFIQSLFLIIPVLQALINNYLSLFILDVCLFTH